jgi:hypothetical protein
MALSPEVMQLIVKARIVRFAAWRSTHPEAAIAIFQAADNDRHYLSDAELAQIASLAPGTTGNFAIVQQIRDQAKEIVDQARSGILAEFPGILEPGGGLYPPERAEACWRDFWQFLRCITYGIAGGQVEYTSAEGLGYMQQLYQALQVPLDAMVYGLEGLKTATLSQIDLGLADTHDRESLLPYFDHLIAKLDAFRTIEQDVIQ